MRRKHTATVRTDKGIVTQTIGWDHDPTPEQLAAADQVLIHDSMQVGQHNRYWRFRALGPLATATADLMKSWDNFVRVWTDEVDLTAFVDTLHSFSYREPDLTSPHWTAFPLHNPVSVDLTEPTP